MHSPSCKIIQNKGGLRTKGYLKKSYEGKPLISIITVVFNGEQHLEETIQSVINQTYENVEYIIIDGGSSDGTLDIIKKYENKIDYWVSERDEGIYDAMNKGIKLAQGDIIGIVNSDDILYPKTLQDVVAVFYENKNIGFVYGKLDIVDFKGILIENKNSLGMQHFKYRLFKHMPFLHPTVFVKKEVYEKIGLFDTRYTISADYDFCLRMIEQNIASCELYFTTGKFRLGGISGSMKTYLENHMLLKNRLASPLRYLNTTILIVKFLLRKINSDTL